MFERFRDIACGRSAGGGLGDKELRDEVEKERRIQFNTVTRLGWRHGSVEVISDSLCALGRRIFCRRCLVFRLVGDALLEVTHALTEAFGE